MALDLHEQVNDTESQSILHLISLLLDVYMLMSEAWDADLAAKTARHVLLLYSALSKEADSDGSPLWRVKPTFHVFSELTECCAESGMNPREFWNYRDEDFGGAVAAFGRRRGGPQSTREFSRGCMTKFMGQPVVRLVRRKKRNSCLPPQGAAGQGR